MRENRQYEIQGTVALARREDWGSDRNVIDYDVARRSYEARQRLAARQAGLSTNAHAFRKQQIAPSMREDRLQRIVEDAYTPNRSILDAVGDLGSKAYEAISSHPFAYQLRHGSLRGRPLKGATYRQVFSTTAFCAALSCLMVFLGA